MAFVNVAEDLGMEWRGGAVSPTAARLVEPIADKIVGRVARSRMSVLITGETGVGKDVMARRIHSASPRADKPFVAVNCAAFADTLVESELFGHERGAFTGADRVRVGLFEAAQGGTLFLDEVGELSLRTQAKLLRVLDTQRLSRVGGVAELAIDVRFIAATNRVLADEVNKGAFRADLLFRLDGVRLDLPPLRARPWEILPAAREFLDAFAAREGVTAPTLSPDAVDALDAHRWEGNFRELRNAIERAALLCDEGHIEPHHLGLAPARPTSPAVHSPRPGAPAAVAELIDALNACGGNQTRAAERLHISRRTLISRLELYGITRPQGKRPRPLPRCAPAGAL